MGKSNHLEDLKITVMKTTAQDLRRISEETGLAIGEAVDRLAERMAATDPEIAKILIHEDLVIIPVKLSREQREDVFKEIAKSLLMTFDPDTMVDLVEQAKEEQQEQLDELSSMSDGDLFQMLDSYREMTEFDN